MPWHTLSLRNVLTAAHVHPSVRSMLFIRMKKISPVQISSRQPLITTLLIRMNVMNAEIAKKFRRV